MSPPLAKGAWKRERVMEANRILPFLYAHINVACTLATFFGTNVTLFVVLIEADYVKVIIATGCYFDEVILCGCRVLLSFSYVYNSAMDCSGFWVPMAVALLESVCKILSPPGFLCVPARFAMCSHHMQLSFIRTELELRSIYHYLY